MKPLAPKSLLQERYQILEIIGKGGMGEVYLATDTRLGNKVALKRTTVGDDDMLAAAFEQEARTLAGLRHPVLPKVSDHFLENDEQFLVMDYILGHDLGKRLKETNKPFPVNWVLFWADQLLEALTYLHTHSPPIIHRDIKPQNLKLTGENQIVLLDFGLSKNSLGNTRVTTSGSVVGYTPHYAPMEQIRGTGTNAKSDIYALSATLYQLLTNTVPADALTRADSLLANLPDPLSPLSELNAEVSEALSSAIMKGLDISQDKRFDDARSMQKSLRRAYNNIQDSMSAETVAFNVGATDELSAGLAAPDINTEAGMAPPVAPVAVDESVSPDASENVDFSAEATEVFSPEELDVPAEPPAVPDAGAGISEILSSEPRGDKTAVLLDHVLPGTGNAETSEVPSGFESEGDFGVADDTGFDTGFEDEPSQVPDATVPLISLEGADVPGEVEPEEPVEEDASYAAAAGATAPVSAAPEAGAAKAVAAKPAKKKSSTGKYVGILAGIAAALVLVAGAVGAGLYFLSQSGGFMATDEDPTPSIEASVEPTAPATIEQSLPMEPTPEEGNVNSEQNGMDSSPEIVIPRDSTPVRTATPLRRTPTPAVRRATPRKATPRKPRTPVRTPVKKKTPKKKDPGVL